MRSLDRPVHRGRAHTLLRLVPSRGGVGFDVTDLLAAGTDEHAGAGDVVHRGDPSVDGVVVVRKGEVRMLLPQRDATPVLVGILGPRGVVGDVPTIAGEAEPYVSVAGRPSLLSRLTVEAFVRYVTGDPRRWLQWSSAATRRLVRVERRLAGILSHQLVEQIASLLSDAPSDRDGRVDVSHDDLALLLGVRRPSISRALARLRDDGLVETGYGHIRVLDPDRLRRVSET